MNKKFLLAFTALSALSLATRADIIPTLDSVTGSAPDFVWHYTANVTTDETVTNGDFFTIYDFSSVKPTIFGHPSFWTFSSALVGPTAPLTSPTDDPSLWNITFTYIGQTPISGAAALGVFSAVTHAHQLKTGQFTAEATKSSDPTGTKVSNVGNVSVPVPEPSALFPLLSVASVIGIDGFLRRRKKTA
jgi:hypothetical protein